MKCCNSNKCKCKDRKDLYHYLVDKIFDEIKELKEFKDILKFLERHLDRYDISKVKEAIEFNLKDEMVEDLDSINNHIKSEYYVVKNLDEIANVILELLDENCINIASGYGNCDKYKRDKLTSTTKYKIGRFFKKYKKYHNKNNEIKRRILDEIFDLRKNLVNSIRNHTKREIIYNNLIDKCYYVSNYIVVRIYGELKEYNSRKNIKNHAKKHENFYRKIGRNCLLEILTDYRISLNDLERISSKEFKNEIMSGISSVPVSFCGTDFDSENREMINPDLSKRILEILDNLKCKMKK